ncbi:neuroendocrine convertase 1 [Fopius arisanus]|uniref:Neuroendocrine convertase 1 n=2 Tax=Fopius arisanus TaxID=64838 RepID=A0A9R1THC6_9HYME|nr:PREDICTED: neuroendocrine convertase 1-like [Fopius arisanus]XP_011309648.1 PREDICTED: neuroendocrine convertase 1-like [Fopius arisanus]
MGQYFIAANLCILLTLLGSSTPTNSTENNSSKEEWVVRVAGGPQVASLLALRSGYKNLGLVLGFKDTYLWHRDDNQVGKRGGGRFVKELTSNSKIIWADQQRSVERHKRDLIDILESEKPLLREKRVFDNEENDIEIHSDVQHMFNDELWNEEWYLQDTRTNRDLPKLDLNVVPLYRLGITGRGMRIAVLDDGLEYTHSDLRNNYSPDISYDVNDGDNDPLPRYEVTGMNGHGTRCAGEIAMEANNRKCGVGVAFEAKIGGIKMLDGVVNDRVEGEALGYAQHLVDVYTASWGPADDGKSLEAPGRLATEALQRGVTEGRKGRGSIYVWASGNGGSKDDDCSCDGYVGSIYTIAVGSASQTGKFPWYGERCPATLATTYSSGAYHDQMIATTDLKNECTTRHTGTSASAPLAAGILALALQVNKELTWRDVQHLIVQTSEYSPLSGNPGWRKNSAGFWFNPRFGFGLMNAHGLVTAAHNWTRVPEKTICFIKSQSGPLNLFYGEAAILRFNSNGCSNENREVMYLEHVQVETSIRYTSRGALEMHLISPAGTRVKILTPRRLDDSTEGFKNWKFMSVGTWGEDPRGTWRLDIIDQVGPIWNNGSILDVTLILHGTKLSPDYRGNSPRNYNDNYNRVRKTNRVVEKTEEKKRMRSGLTGHTNEINLTEQVGNLESLVWTDWLRRILFDRR